MGKWSCGMASSATTVAAMAARAQRKILSYFFAMHAVTAEDAVPYKPERRLQRRQFERMLARGVVREVPGGKYWVDVAAYDRMLRRRRMILVPIVIALCVALAAGLTLFYQG